jgi:hypothetical protein
VIPVAENFQEQFMIPEPPNHAANAWLLNYGTVLTTQKYRVVGQSPEGFVYERVKAPGWAKFIAVILFPIGLLALDRASAAR